VRASLIQEGSFISNLVTSDQDMISSYPCDIYQDPSKLEIKSGGFDANFKLILIGNSGVGKSCIIKRIGSNSFSEDHEVTIGAEFTTIAAHVDRKRFFKMMFWDSCG
jgi:GTPase SAR1 family protein